MHCVDPSTLAQDSPGCRPGIYLPGLAHLREQRQQPLLVIAVQDREASNEQGPCEDLVAPASDGLELQQGSSQTVGQEIVLRVLVAVFRKDRRDEGDRCEVHQVVKLGGWARTTQRGEPGEAIEERQEDLRVVQRVQFVCFGSRVEDVGEAADVKHEMAQIWLQPLEEVSSGRGQPRRRADLDLAQKTHARDVIRAEARLRAALQRKLDV